MNKIYESAKLMQEKLLSDLNRTEAFVGCDSKNEEFLEIAKYDQEACFMAFAEFGEILYQLSQDIDCEHPEVSSGKFIDHALLKKLRQFIQICHLARQNELQEIYSSISKASKFVIPDIKSYLNQISTRHQYVRLFKNPTLRQSFRSQKTIQKIQLDSPIKRIKDLWDSSTEFSEYFRFKNFYQNEIDKIKSRAEIYKTLGLDSMYGLLISSSIELEQLNNTQYLGFQRVPMTSAAVMLAKMHGCVIDESNSDLKLSISSSVFDNHIFDEGFIHHNKDENGLLIGSKNYPFAAFSYPAHMLDYPSNEISSLMNRLEAMPELNGKPAFDHYLVIVPTIAMNMNFNYFYDFSDKKVFFYDYNVGRYQLDTLLIKEKKIAPVLAGEKDGKCYFICFWV